MSTRHAFLLSLAVLFAACGGQSTEPHSKPIIAEVTVVPNSASLTIGQTAQFSALAYDGEGNAMDPSGATWTSSASDVVAITPAGLVTAVGSGTATISATIAGQQGAAVVTVSPNSLVLDIENDLIYPVQVRADGMPIATVPAQTTQHVVAPAAKPGASVDWQLIQPTLGGRPLGDPMSGTFAPGSATATTRHIVIDNLIGSDYYFAPVVNNSTGSDLLMVVNYQLGAENRCNCVVPAGGSNVAFGYYHLYSNSNITAFRSSSNYTGPYYYFYNFGDAVPVGSGRREFTYTIAP